MGQAAPKMCHMQEVTVVPMQEGDRGCGEWRAVDDGSHEAQIVGCGDSCSSKAGCPQDSACCRDPADSRVEEVLVVHHKAYSAVRYMLQTEDFAPEGPGPAELPGAVVAMRQARRERQLQNADGADDASAGDCRRKHRCGKPAAQPGGDLGGEGGAAAALGAANAPSRQAAGQVRELACTPGAWALAAGAPEARDADGGRAPGERAGQEPALLKAFERKMCRGLRLQRQGPADDRGGAEGGGARLRLLAGHPAPPIFALAPEGAGRDEEDCPRAAAAAQGVEEVLLPLGAITCVVGTSPPSCEHRASQVSISIADGRRRQAPPRLAFRDGADARDFREWMRFVSGSEVVLEASGHVV